MKQDIKVFNASTVRQSFIDCVEAGYRPCTAIETLHLIGTKKIEDVWYDSATLDVYEDGVVVAVRDATTDDIKKIVSGTYKNEDVRPWYVDHLYDWSRANGNNHLDLNYGRLVGVRGGGAAKKKSVRK